MDVQPALHLELVNGDMVSAPRKLQPLELSQEPGRDVLMFAGPWASTIRCQITYTCTQIPALCTVLDHKTSSHVVVLAVRLG